MRNKYSLSVLIPMYKEGEEVVKPLLDSIALQLNVDFDEIEAVITHDGIIPEDADYRLSEEFLNSYPFNITYLEMEHKGVSAARNYCLDHCNGKYVQFCDCDDMFHNMCGLWIVFREIENGGFDSLMCAFVEETRNPETGEVVYINHDLDSTFVHSKFHRREFLAKNKIRWNENLRIHEDSFFNCLCQRLAGRTQTGMKYCPTPFYLWKWRDESVCRHDPKYILKTFPDMVKSNSSLVREFKNRGMENEAMFYATSMVYDSYYTLNKKEWIDEENADYRHTLQVYFKKYWDTYKDLYNKLPEKDRNQIIAGMKNRFMGEGVFLETQTFNDWIKEIEALELTDDETAINIFGENN